MQLKKQSDHSLCCLPFRLYLFGCMTVQIFRIITVHFKFFSYYFFRFYTASWMQDIVFKVLYLHLPMTRLRWTYLDQLSMKAMSLSLTLHETNCIHTLMNVRKMKFLKSTSQRTLNRNIMMAVSVALVSFLHVILILINAPRALQLSPKLTFSRQNFGKMKYFDGLKPFWVMFCHLFPIKKEEEAYLASVW